MQLLENVSLLPYNTFGLEARAAHFADISSLADLRAALATGIQPVFVLGGGSNILFTRDVPGLVIRNNIRGMELIRQFKNRAWVRAGGGESWHALVLWALRHHFGGLENLSLIPGSVGAAPVQNIGAYGVELKDLFVRLEAVDVQTGALQIFSRRACRFAYRDSIFKREYKGRFCITSVTLSLSVRRHRLNTAYGDILKTLDALGVRQPGIADISRAVIQIRTSKLPDPSIAGNCGSFFKNPELPRQAWEKFHVAHPAAPNFQMPDGRVKVPAGWLIEQCGWKGKRLGGAGCYEKQALVLVNHGGATGGDVKALAAGIIASVQEKYGIELEPEVNII